MWKNTGGARLLAHFLWLPIRFAYCALARTVELCAGLFGALCARASAFWRPGARWPWGRGAGSRGKRRSFGGFSGKSEAVGSGVADDESDPGIGVREHAGRRLMSARAVHLVIDARPRGPRGLLAAEVVLGRERARSPARPGGRARARRASRSSCTRATEEHGRLRELAGRSASRAVVFVSGPPRADAAVLRTDRFYDAGRLRRGLRRGRSPESAVLWRLDRPESLSTAERRADAAVDLSAAGKILGVSRWRERLAERLCPTSIRPNALTLARRER